MDLHQLYVFVKVVEHKSFSKAANDIFLSQSTVSSHIQALEKMFDAPLFDRVGRESILTPQGERLYKWAQKLLALKDELLLDMKNDLTDFSGIVKIAASSVPAQFIVPKMIQQFRKEFSQASFQMTQSPSKTVAEQVSNGTVDIGFLGEKYDDDKLVYTPLMKEKLVLVTTKDVTFQEPVKLEEIVNHPFIMRNSNSGTQSTMKKLLKKKGVEMKNLNVVATTDCVQCLMQFVKLGIGISIISEIAAIEYSKNNPINIYEIENMNEERDFYLVYNKNKTLPIVSKMFIEKAPQYIEKEIVTT